MNIPDIIELIEALPADAAAPKKDARYRRAYADAITDVIDLLERTDAQ